MDKLSKDWENGEKKKKKEKNSKVKDYRRFNSQPRRETDRAKVVYINEVFEEIMQLQIWSHV